MAIDDLLDEHEQGERVRTWLRKNALGILGGLALGIAAIYGWRAWVSHQASQQERPDLTYANVLRLMQVMHGKGLLNRDESQRSHVYSAAHAQDALQTNLLKDLIHKAFAGSGKDLVLAALSSHVTDDERDEIKRFLKENPSE